MILPVMVGELPERKCHTHHLPVHGYEGATGLTSNPLSVYGHDRTRIEDIGHKTFGKNRYLSESLGIEKAQVTWAVREEMARNLEDVLARRTRALFLDAKESLRIAPEAVKIMALELGEDQQWIQTQLESYDVLASRYLIDNSN